MSQWAEAKRRLSPEASAEPGDWRNDRFPPLVGIMDAISDPANKDISVMKSAQVGVSECLLNTIGFHIDLDPCAMLYVHPTVEMAEAFSKDRIVPMVRDARDGCLSSKVDASKETESTVLQKRFPGGHLTLGGANSPASLAGRPVRKGLYDDIDRFPLSAGEEGDPIALGTKRTNNWFNRQNIKVSTPTKKRSSRINRFFLAGSQHRYFVACPQCGHEQVLEWKNVKWEKGHETDAFMVCVANGCVIRESDKQAMLVAAVQRPDKGWRATNPNPTPGRLSFHINELYSTWRTWAEVVDDFLDAKGVPEKLQVWTNTVLGEVWNDEDEATVVTTNELFDRREDYKEPPKGVLVIVASVDVQDDRLECEVRGFGEKVETWGLAYRVFWGGPANAEVWGELHEWLMSYKGTTPDGRELHVRACGVDTRGHHTKMAYAFVGKLRKARIRYFALMGIGGIGQPTVGKSRIRGIQRVPVFPVGTNTIKDSLFARLKVQLPEDPDEAKPGCLHWPMTYDAEYFDQLTSSEVVVTRYRHGVEYRVYEKTKEGARNEALDLLVYAYAVLDILQLNLTSLGRRVRAAATKAGKAVTKAKPVEPAPKTEAPEPATPPADEDEFVVKKDLRTGGTERPVQQPRKKRKGGWMTRYR